MEEEDEEDDLTEEEQADLDRILDEANKAEGNPGGERKAEEPDEFDILVERYKAAKRNNADVRAAAKKAKKADKDEILKDLMDEPSKGDLILAAYPASRVMCTDAKDSKREWFSTASRKKSSTSFGNEWKSSPCSGTISCAIYVLP